MTRSRLLPLFLAFALLSGDLSAQYFGQNKVRYEAYDFKVLKTEHFSIHYYEEEAEAAAQVGRMAERWYWRLSRILQHELTPDQPIILYASPPAFRGTTAISGEIGEGTGGVTEGLRRRVVMPLAGPMGETDHVLGHELVHAFQFDMAYRSTNGGRTALNAALNLPLWFVEGMAEYLSVGPVDPQTAMWLRDAVAREDLPAIKDLSHPRYFPYRYGQAFWSFIAGRFGDEAIGRILRAGLRTQSVVNAIADELQIPGDQLSAEWHAELLKTYQPVLNASRPPEEEGRLIAGSLDADPGRSLNVAPILSPDGRRMAFFSAKDLFSIDLFVADAETGKIERKITKTAGDPHFDSLGFVNSAGAWSWDGQRFAFGGVSGGRPEVEIHRIDAGGVERRIKLRELGEVLNLTWSPKGDQIVLSATKQGWTDLFLLDLESGDLRQLTRDAFADLQPAWSPDGRRIAFVTDRFTSNLAELSFGDYRLAMIDPRSGNIENWSPLDAGKQINPQWSADSASVLFVSDRDGVANIYRATLEGRRVSQLTNLQTGVTGISDLSPAFSVAQQTGRLAFTVFGNGNYAIYRKDGDALTSVPVSEAVTGLNAAALPPVSRRSADVADYLKNDGAGLARTDQFETTPYKARLELDYVAAPEIGVGFSSFGSMIGGGTALRWSDLLGYHNVTTVFQTALSSDGGNLLNNLAAVGIYENQRSRWNWGFSAGQVPFVSGAVRRRLALVNGQQALIEESARLWEIHRELAATLSYPFNRAQRVEFTSGFRNISFDAESRTTVVALGGGSIISDQEDDIPTLPGLRLGIAGAALVYDTSIFGGVSPITGQSYRLEYSVAAGSLTYSSVLADYRRYFRIRPLTIAGRVLQYGRFGSGGEDSRLQQLFLGYPALVRGYDPDSFSAAECGAVISQTGACPVFDKLLGSRLAVANAEIRVPVLGPLGVIPSEAVPPVETALFYDAGAAWTSAERLTRGRWVSSYGAALRVNLLGFAVAQLSYVHPNDRPLKDWMWQFDFVPGF